MDDADFVQEQILREEEAHAKQCRAAAAAAVKQVYSDCRFCFKALPDDPKRRAAGFCDEFCRDDWQKRVDAKQRNGT